MPIFQYTATDQAGAQSQGNFEAANEQQAYEQLAQYGLSVSQLIPLDPPAEQPSLIPEAEPEVKGKKKKKPKVKASKAKGKKKKSKERALSEAL